MCYETHAIGFDELRNICGCSSAIKRLKNNAVEKDVPLELLQFIQKYNPGNSVPNIVGLILLRIFLTIAVSVATCERSFSKLNLIKNYLRSNYSMSTLWLRNLATLSTEKQLTDNINFDIAVEEFANHKARKVTVQKIIVFSSETKIVLIFYTFFTISPICHFCILFNCHLQRLILLCIFKTCHI